mmetsp:Transcript_14135/g.34213  ORF Transcript_14135/g.34213 Transcript_14135/m.34213 type:complete len:351 (-) Transcript_14135:35-1087(-)
MDEPRRGGRALRRRAGAIRAPPLPSRVRRHEAGVARPCARSPCGRRRPGVPRCAVPRGRRRRPPLPCGRRRRGNLKPASPDHTRRSAHRHVQGHLWCGLVRSPQQRVQGDDALGGRHATQRPDAGRLARRSVGLHRQRGDALPAVRRVRSGGRPARVCCRCWLGRATHRVLPRPMLRAGGGSGKDSGRGSEPRGSGGSSGGGEGSHPGRAVRCRRHLFGAVLPMYLPEGASHEGLHELCAGGCAGPRAGRHGRPASAGVHQSYHGPGRHARRAPAHVRRRFRGEAVCGGASAGARRGVRCVRGSSSHYPKYLSGVRLPTIHHWGSWGQGWGCGVFVAGKGVFGGGGGGSG